MVNPAHIVDLPFIERDPPGEMAAFYANGSVAVVSGRIAFVNGRSYDIEIYELDGTLVERFGRVGEVVPVTQEDIDEFVARSRRNIEAFGGDPQAETRLANLIVPETMPTVRGALPDPEGNIWVERYLGVQHSRPVFYPGQETFEIEASIWDVFSEEGFWLGTVDLIPGLFPVQIGADWILMVGENDVGVAQVLLYELIKP